MISERKQALLKEAFRRGDTHEQAAAYAEVTAPTVGRYFARFADEGMMRGPRRRKFKDCPIYDGPDWIGKPAPTRHAVNPGVR